MTGGTDDTTPIASILSRLPDVLTSSGSGNRGIEHFTELVSGMTADTLEDDEAATIAYGLEHGATTLIDERKANRICAERFAALTIGCTVDLLAHDAIEAALGQIGLANAVFNALYHGRMRVRPRHVDWVVNLIGPERAAQCASLPRSVRSVEAAPTSLPEHVKVN